MPAAMPTATPAVSNAPLDFSAARGAVAPFEALDTCHQQMVRALDQMEEVVQRLKDHGLDGKTREMARNVFLFFMNTAREHHADEEKYVFPAMIRSGDEELIRHTLRLQQDHGWIEEDWRELAPQFESIAAGYNWYNIEHLEQAVPVFRALCLDHIALEESLIYPQAKARLAAWEMQGMGREMSQRRRQQGAKARAA